MESRVITDRELVLRGELLAMADRNEELKERLCRWCEEAMNLREEVRALRKELDLGGK